MNKLKRKLREKFTKWYVKKGWTFGYDGILPLNAVWHCPWYIKPLLFLFSPSIYDIEITTNYICKGFMEGLQSSIKLEFDNFVAKEGLTNDKL